MLYHLLPQLADLTVDSAILERLLNVFNVFRYQTFRAAGAMVTSLFLAFVLGPAVIRWLRRVRFGQVVRELSAQQMRVLLYGSGDESVTVKYRNREGQTRHYSTKYEGVIPNLWRRYNESTSDYVREKLEEYMVDRPCRACGGARLQPVARAVDIGGMTIVDAVRRPVVKSLEWAQCLEDLERTPLTPRQQKEGWTMKRVESTHSAVMVLMPSSVSEVTSMSLLWLKEMSGSENLRTFRFSTTS